VENITTSLSSRWSDWDRFPGARPFQRPEVDQILAGLDRQSLVEIRGCRGVGKSTLLRLVAQRLVQRGLEREGILFIDLEDPVWAPNPHVEDLDRLLAQSGQARAILVDGVERLPGWVDWARRLRSSRRVMVAAARSGPVGGFHAAGVMGLDCNPLPFSSWMQIFTDKKVNSENARALLQAYLRSGGLPVTRKAEGRIHALLELFFSSLMKDVILLRPVRDTNVLTAVSVHAIGRSGKPLSASRLKGHLTRSVDQARMFLEHLEAAGLIYLVQRLEDAGRASQAARLCFAADTGLAWALGSRLSTGGRDGSTGIDPGLALTAVFLQFLREHKRCWAWRHSGRHGLAIGEPDGLELLVDVQVGKGKASDMAGLAAIMEQTGCASGLLLTTDPGAGAEPALAGKGVIETRALGPWLMDHELTDKTVDVIQTDTKVDKYSGGLPPHLL